jgi:hypothetical protein
MYLRTSVSWLHRFPAFKWLEKEPSVVGALASFKRVQKKRPLDAKFSDDFAEIRFWTLASWAPRSLNVSRKKSLDKAGREQVIAAAKKLSQVARDSAVFRDANIDLPESQLFLSVLDQLQSLSVVAKRRRTDAFSAGREFVISLSAMSIMLFDDAPPALICELAAMGVSNPDVNQITHQISDYKRARASKRRNA